MPQIVLATINAKYIHAAFGLRYLAANLGPLRADSKILEFTAEQRPADMAEAILSLQPRIVGLGVYIWNAVQSLELVSILTKVAPKLKIILGGPEVSHEYEEQEIVHHADYVVTGEGEHSFRRLCTSILEGRPSLTKIHPGDTGDLDALVFPYALYDEQDIAHRVIYVEASRGCPFRCEFCLSSLDKKVRPFPMGQFLAQMETLLDRGVLHFKFVDRTFNLDLTSGSAILDFFLERMRPGLFLHFEMIPDRFPELLRERITRFPPGTLQFEVGIQSFDPEVGKRISRRQNFDKLRKNLDYIRDYTHVHLHTDLIIGLPGETADGFATGFDKLVAMQVEEIQVGVLKRLRGVPISRHTEAWNMRYSAHPPYEVLQTGAIDFPTMQRLKRFAQCWNSLVNRGNFHDTAPQIWEGKSPFHAFLAFSDWLFKHVGRVHSIALIRLGRYLMAFLIEHRDGDAALIDRSLRADFTRAGRKDPGVFRPLSAMLNEPSKRPQDAKKAAAPARQARHQGTA